MTKPEPVISRHRSSMGWDLACLQHAQIYGSCWRSLDVPGHIAYSRFTMGEGVAWWYHPPLFVWGDTAPLAPFIDWFRLQPKLPRYLHWLYAPYTLQDSTSA